MFHYLVTLLKGHMNIANSNVLVSQTVELEFIFVSQNIVHSVQTEHTKRPLPSSFLRLVFA